MSDVKRMWPIVGLLTLGACEQPVEVQPETAATAVQPEPFDLAGYCAAMCERTTECGMKAAEATAALGGVKTEEALRQAKAEYDTHVRACGTGCQRTPINDDNRGLALRAKQCLDASDCADLEQCLTTL